MGASSARAVARGLELPAHFDDTAHMRNLRVWLGSSSDAPSTAVVTACALGLLAFAAAAGCSGDSGESSDSSMPTSVTIQPSTASDGTTEGPTTGPTTNSTNNNNTTTTTTTTTPMTSDPGSTSEATSATTAEVTATETEGATTGEPPPPELDTYCLVVHQGGDPATLASVRVDEDGTLTELAQTVELGGGHSPEATDYRRRGLVSCGDYVYAAMLDDDKVAAIDVGYYGELTVISEISVPNIEGVMCNQEDELVFTFGRNAGSAALRSFGINEDGSLDPSDNVDLDYSYTGNMQLYGALHPSQRILYLAGKTEGPGDSDVEIHKVNYSNSGGLVPDNVTSLLGNLLFGIELAPSGDELAVIAWNGVFAWHNLPVNGQVPAAANLVIINDTEWQAGNDIAIRTDPSSDEHFYYARTSGTGEIRVGEFLGDQVMYYATEPGPGKRQHLHLAWEDTVLLSIAQTGDMQSWTLDAEGVELTPVSSLDIGGTTVQASDLVPCAAQE